MLPVEELDITVTPSPLLWAMVFSLIVLSAAPLPMWMPEPLFPMEMALSLVPI